MIISDNAISSKSAPGGAKRLAKALQSWRIRKAPPPSEARQWIHRQARLEWDTRLGTAVMAAANWRRGFFGVLIIAGILILWTTTLVRAVVAKPRAVPFVVEIDGLGTARYRGPVGESAKTFKIPERAIRQQLKRFISDLRTVSSDRAVITSNVLEAWNWATNVGQNLISKLVTESNPYNRALEERVSVEVQEVLALSQDSWRMQWTETRFDPNGNQVGTVAWGGAFRLVFRLSDDGISEELLEKNPLGLYVDYFDIQQLQK